MYLLHEELARAQCHKRLAEAQEARRAWHLRRANRLNRRTERLARRAERTKQQAQLMVSRAAQ